MARHIKINWGAVYEFYLSGEKISYTDCAARFGINRTTVGDKGRAENWAQKKADIYQAATALTRKKMIDIISQRQEKHIELARELQSGALAQLRKGIVPTQPRDIKDWAQVGVDMERKALGMDQRGNGNLKITNPDGVQYDIRWGDGSSLDAF